ncbi:uncharacterized protein NECHADRAFT_102196 [Fusarium vanettenii 77-13-4]|uniref:CBM-cenC domain-containing protein n=1 Tax=Fusarium vanettenii (strain ATCC MYA-4622 / CBS 123669 / FGSC 9596 / NRRL 45880 / 77-13-4) TaxID=660122 RepID=C7ZL81_FUSV7|nr:uncharacterized protein NECHADRAFT_102196 [Fusarium vanettenii 77-13-4]EEU35268.1 hypothetical protein NECHADRAFT_102196 [Fusarium vanettenii 77-13-4]
MARHFVALLAAFGALGANAAVCRPSSLTTVATTTTEASSTVSVGSSTVTESSTVSIESSTTITEASTSTQESSTIASTTATTSSAEVCVETQILVNPSFDDNDNGTPWIFGDGTQFSSDLSRSQPYGVLASLTQAASTRQFRQTIPRVSPHNYRLQYYLINYSAVSAPSFACYVTPSINGQELAQGTQVGTSGQIGWNQGEAFWSTPSETEDAIDVDVVFNVSCEGSFSVVLVVLDDTSLTRVCSAQD